jgi:hypothetical protein
VTSKIVEIPAAEEHYRGMSEWIWTFNFGLFLNRQSRKQIVSTPPARG